MSSRENFDTQHMSRPSMDDLNVAKISGTGLTASKASSQASRSIQIPNFTGTVAYRGRNATDPVPSLVRSDDEEEDVFGGRSINDGRAPLKHMRRRSSLPDALHDPTSASDEEENDSDAENQFEDSSMNANPSHTIHVSTSGRRVLRSLLSRDPSPEPESERMQRMRRSETRSPSRPRGLGSQFELHALEDALARVLDERLAELKGVSANGNAASSSEAMLSEVISLFRAQLQDSAAKSLEDTTMEARNDMDMFMIREMLQDGQREVVSVVKTVVEEHLHHALMERTRGSDDTINELKQVVENAASKTIGAVVDAITDFRADQGSSPASEEDREALLDDIVTTLTPMLQGLRTEPVDYDFLTNELAQAVKPHISQLIDLASDKRETAGLIIDALIPTLVSTLVPSLVPTLTPSLISNLAPALMDVLLERLQTENELSRLSVLKEVRKAVEGVDAIEIRDAVADLVVERLNARLDSRDRTFIGSVKASVAEVVENVSSRLEAKLDEKEQEPALSEQDLKRIETRIVDGVKSSVAGVHLVPGLLEESFNRLSQEQQAVAQTFAGIEKRALDGTAKILGHVDNSFGSLASKTDVESFSERVNRFTREAALSASASASEMKALLEILLAENRALAEKNAELTTTQQTMATKLASLPEVLNSAIVNLQNGVSELIVSRDVPKKDLEDLKKLNSDYQVQLTKARAAHGQVRVEKDMLGERLAGIESERERLRAKVTGLEKRKDEETAAVNARKNELEEALANALGRLQSSDVTTQSQQQRIAELEKTVKELATEKSALKANADALEVRATIAEKEKEATAATLNRLNTEHSHWDTVKETSEKVDMLTKLLGEVESDEIKHLRQYQERTKTIEADYVQLQKRVKELETKVANSEKVATTTKSGLLQAQQRASDWEKTAKEYEGELEMVKTRLDQAEQTHDQLDTDYSMLKMQFEEKEADDRFIKVDFTSCAFPIPMLTNHPGPRE